MPRQKSSHKCKHCTFETDNKVDHWQHMKVHMRPDKILECSSCQFVTPYKHHLEYHQRNHIGYKPFKCENCDYQCVNKSMLNSHMRSHSSVYQYQCGDCKYATKYVHSLRTHLMKYSHQEDQMGGYGFSNKKPDQLNTQEPCILDLRVSSKIRKENSFFDHN